MTGVWLSCKELNHLQFYCTECYDLVYSVSGFPSGNLPEVISILQFSIEHFDPSRLRKISESPVNDDVERTALAAVETSREGRLDLTNDQAQGGGESI